MATKNTGVPSSQTAPAPVETPQAETPAAAEAAAPGAPATSVIPASQPAEGATAAARSAEGDNPAADTPQLDPPPAPPSIDIAPAGPSPAEQAAIAAEAPPLRLARDGVELVWEDESGGQFGFVIETSHDGADWKLEAEVPPGTTRYKPVQHPPSNTDFYRIFYRIGALRSAKASNGVVIHFR